MKGINRKNLAIAYIMAVLLTFPLSMSDVYATSLDDVINENVQETKQETPAPAETNKPAETQTQTTTSEHNYVDTDTWIESMRDATDYTQPNEVANKVNSSIKKGASIAVQILAYVTTTFLTVRVLLDLLYIAIPFLRSFLSNGYAGNAQAGGGMNMMNSGMPGMGGGFGGGFGGGMGMSNGFGGGYGMNRMGLGLNGMGIGGMQQGQMGATPALGRIQLISNAALNAVAAEGVPGPSGVAQSALKAYAKDMTITLIATPIFLILAVSGAFTNLGFLLGDALAKMVSSIGGMV